jgi:hypothetical protein
MDLRPEQLRAFSRFGLGAGAWFEGAQRVQAVLGERAVGIDAATQDQGDPVEDRRRNRAGHSSGAAPKVTTAGNLGRAPITELRQEPLQELNPRPTLLAFSTAWNGIPLMWPGWLTGKHYPFDDDNGSFSSWSTTRSTTTCGRPSLIFQPAGGWFTAKRAVLRVGSTSNRTGLLLVVTDIRPKSLGERLAKRRASDK